MPISFDNMVVPPYKNSLKEIWEEWNSSEGPKYPKEKVIQFVFRHFSEKERKEARALDIGCGNGVNTWFLAREGFRVSAIDPSGSAVLKTRNYLEKEGLPYERISEGGFQEISFLKKEFDLIIAVGVLECIPVQERNSAIRSIHELLKPGGFSFLLFAGEGDRRTEGENPLRLNPFSRDEVSELFSHFEWKELNIDRYITTFNNESSLSFNWIVTTKK